MPSGTRPVAGCTFSPPFSPCPSPFSGPVFSVTVGKVPRGRGTEVHIAVVWLLPLSGSETSERTFRLVCKIMVRNVITSCRNYSKGFPSNFFRRKHLLKKPDCSETQFQMGPEAAQGTAGTPVFNSNENITTENLL